MVAPVAPEGNQLQDASSTYLRTARNQPVHWRTWGPSAFEEAKRQGKPVLLDIGAVWCHWCHVMDHESYEDEATARIINEGFVPVKVDRDERPDVDARYQRAVQALTGQGGWPLTAFLTPEGEVFHGGTYFPPTPAHGRPSFRQVLEAVTRLYEEEPEDVTERAERIREVVERSTAGATGSVDLADVDAAVERVREAADPVHGGFGGAPKFPQPGAVDLLLLDTVRAGSDASWSVVEATLDAMIEGGIRDHVGGGFHRYSVDAEWHVPHFEKMATDNAGILGNLVHAVQVRETPRYAAVARETARWCRTVLGDPEDGGFFGSVDADVGPHDDGDHWTWTLEEVRSLLPHDEARIVELRFGVEDRGDMRHDRARNVLQVEATVEDIADALGRDPATVEEDLERALATMLEARNARPKPHVDTTLYTDWNGMLATAFLEAAPVLGDPWLLEHGTRTLERVRATMWSPDEGFAHTVEGEVQGLLGDQVEMARAHLAAHATTLESDHLEAAREVADLLIAHWWDEEDGGFLDVAPSLRGETAGLLEVPGKPVLDTPTPGLNPRAAMVLAALHRATGEATYREHAEATLEAVAGRVEGGGVHAATFHQAAWEVHGTPPTVVLVGDRDATGFDALQQAALSPYAPGRVVLHHTPGDPSGHVPEAASSALEALSAAGPVALVCAGTRCFPPASDPSEVRARVEDAVAGTR